MTAMTQDPILWTGLVMLAGTAGAMAARKVKLPAACGALVGGFVVGGIAGPLGVVLPDIRLVHSLLFAFVCFVMGAEIDLTVLARSGRRLLGSTALQMTAVTAAVWLAGIVCGFGWDTALIVGLAFSATSPTAIIAVASEAGARGPFTQHILATSSLSLLVATLLVYGFGGLPLLLTSHLTQMIMGGAIGLILLVPLSRIETRGAMTACVGCGIFLLALLPPGFPVAPLSGMAIVCGFMAGNLLPNREIVRDTLRGLALPVAILLFAFSATLASPVELWLGAGAGLLLLAGRLAGLYVAGVLTLGRAAGLRHAATQIPIAGLSCPGPAVIGLVVVIEGPEILTAALFSALILSEFAGMIATRWALQRSGEAALLTGNPDAWRASMV